MDTLKRPEAMYASACLRQPSTLEPLRDWLSSWLPASGTLRELIDWLTHPGTLWALGLASALFFVLGLLGVPWFVTRLPADYFSRGEHARALGKPKHPLLRLMTRALRNLFGAFLLLLGISMLVLPGQGLLTITVSLLFIDFPGKRRALAKLIHVPPIFRALNTMRARAGKPPLS